MGCYEISLGDTIGVGTPASIERMINEVVKVVPPQYLAIHAHDTYGQGVANVLQAVDMGIRTVDTSVAGLGGCPYAKGATGNVATEDVVYALHDLGYETGIDMLELSKTGAWISEELSRANAAKAGRAIVAKANL
jgi:hydroxymethylglutaryl-CoA lyase